MVRLLLGLLVLLNVAWAGQVPEATVTLSSEQVWQREQLIVTVSLTTKDFFAKLRVDAFEQSGLVITALPSEKVEVVEQGVTQYTLTAKWAVFLFREGSQILVLPRIRYHPNRGSLKTLKLVNPVVHVNRLPVYIPATLPVGKISLQAEWQEGHFITANHLKHWQVKLLAVSVAKQTLPMVTRQLSSDSSVEYLPVQHHMKTKLTPQGLEYERVSTVPFKVSASGVFDFPSLEVQYFDPEISQLKTAQLETRQVVVLTTFWQWLTGVSLGIIAIIFIYKAVVFLVRCWLKYRRRKLLLSALLAASSYQQLRENFALLADVEGWQVNQTLSEYLQQYESLYGCNKGLSKKIKQVMKQGFSLKK